MKYVMLSSELSLAVMASALVLYLLIGICVRGFKKSGIFTALLAVLNILVHIALIALCLYLKASLEEILLIFVLSTAIALTVTKQRREDR